MRLRENLDAGLIALAEEVRRQPLVGLPNHQVAGTEEAIRDGLVRKLADYYAQNPSESGIVARKRRLILEKMRDQRDRLFWWEHRHDTIAELNRL